MGAKRPIFKLQKKITLYGLNLHTNVTYVQNLRFVHWMIWRTACGQTWKNGFWHFFCARSAQFLNYKKKISLHGINPNTNVTYMQNLRFLHWTVWRTACGQTWKNGFWHVFLRAKRPIFKLRKKISLYGINLHTNMTYKENLRFLHWMVWRTACGQTWK